MAPDLIVHAVCVCVQQLQSVWKQGLHDLVVETHHDELCIFKNSPTHHPWSVKDRLFGLVCRGTPQERTILLAVVLNPELARVFHACVLLECSGSRVDIEILPVPFVLQSLTKRSIHRQLQVIPDQFVFGYGSLSSATCNLPFLTSEHAPRGCPCGPED